MYMNSVDVIHIASENDIERNTLLAILDVVNHLKGFYCDIMGGFVYNWRVLGIMKNEPLIFRIVPQFLPMLLNMMSMKYHITQEHVPGEYPFIYTYVLESKTTVISKIVIKALFMSKRTFRTYSCDFDINLLAEDDSCMYVRAFPLSMRFILDKLTFIKERVCQKRFCIVEKISNGKTTREISNIIESAIRLTENGWFMDDFLLRSNAWVVARWGDLKRRTQFHRSSYDREKGIQLQNCDECCLCQEKFRDSDVVLNTPCNHNHHWICSPDNSHIPSGLKCWVHDQNKLCCPCCRADMF